MALRLRGGPNLVKLSIGGVHRRVKFHMRLAALLTPVICENVPTSLVARDLKILAVPIPLLHLTPPALKLASTKQELLDEQPNNCDERRHSSNEECLPPSHLIIIDTARSRADDETS